MARSAGNAPLAERSVWLSRPAERAGDWQAALEARGARVFVEPLIRIEPVSATPALAAQIRAAEQADIVIATSAAAIDALAVQAPAWAPTGRLVAVGQATAAALRAITGRTVAVPETHDSEGLLARPELAGENPARVALLTGEGGRTLLADTLAERGFDVERVALYRRRAARLAPSRLAELLSVCDTLVITSEAAWRALIDQCGPSERKRLAELFLVAASPRVVQITLCDIDWQHTPAIIAPMSGQGVCDALAGVRWARSASSCHAIPGESDSA
ncbi:MAG: hypothetical protein CMP08_09195 [Xanthomonadales bacterium]|nr:hypothetical protein [Xanthomonadales bacterium]